MEEIHAMKESLLGKGTFTKRKNMAAYHEQMTHNWWAKDDIPVHNNSRVTYLVDGRSAMLTICYHLLKARKYIYIASWGMTPGMELVRGTDHRAGPDGSPEQEALLAELRIHGLEQADIDFWCTHDLSVQAVLGYAVSKGVEIKVLLWDCLVLPFRVRRPLASAMGMNSPPPAGGKKH